MSRKIILIIGYTWPEPTSTAAGNRMLQLIDFFLVADYKIVFSSTASETELSLDLKALGVQMAPIRLNDSGFDIFINDLNPNIVLFDRYLTEEQFGWRVAEFAPNAIRILDTEDLHSLRDTREKLLKEKLSFTVEAWLKNDKTKREIASVYRCDLSLIISSFEMHLLTETLKIEPNLLLHLPFMVAEIGSNEIENWPSFNERKDFVCIGNGKHSPNVDAIVWLEQKIWPQIRKAVPTANVFVYGAYLPQRVKQMHNPKEGFLIKGRVDSAQSAMSYAKVSLAPLRFGAGIKGKLLLSMQTGTPSVTTSIGAEGMYGNFPWNGKIEDTVACFTRAAVQLYSDRNEWQNAQERGIAIINEIYNKEKHHEILKLRLQYLQQHMEKLRSLNFIGSMLQHHTMQTTKFLAKWIEEKNSKR